MAQVKLSVEELLTLARSEMPIEEIKKQLAKGMLEVWNSQTSQALIEEEAERLARVKIERIIRDAYQENRNGVYGRLPNYTGWAIPILKQVLKENFSIAAILETIKPEIDTMVQESMGRALAAFFTKGGEK
jgi:hypothetical protein